MPTNNSEWSIGRRKMLKTTGAIAGAGVLAGCTGGSDGGGGDGGSDSTPTATPKPSYKSNIGQVGFDLASIPHTAAVREFMPENTDDRMEGVIRDFSSGTLQLQSLIAGDIDFYGSGPGGTYQAQIAGNQLRIIATKISGTDYLIALSGEVDSLSDFVDSDLQFGISSPGALSHIQPIGVFTRENIDHSKINFVKIGGSGDRTRALAAGNIDGAALHLSQFQQLENEGVNVKNAGMLTDYFPNFLQECVATRADVVEDHPEFCQAYIDALYQANKRAMNDFDWTYRMTQKYQAAPLEESTARESWELNVNVLSAWPYEDFSKTGYQGVLDMMHEGGLLDKSEVDLDAMFEPKFADAAIENLS